MTPRKNWCMRSDNSVRAPSNRHRIQRLAPLLRLGQDAVLPLPKVSVTVQDVSPAPDPGPAETRAANRSGRRYGIVAAGLGTLLALAVYLEASQPTYVQVATGLTGDHWYRIQLGDRHVGYMYNSARRDRRGEWHFETTTHLAAASGRQNTISRYQHFAAARTA